MDARKKRLGMFKVQQKDCVTIMKALDENGDGSIDCEGEVVCTSLGSFEQPNTFT